MTVKTAKPFLKWAGGKTQLINEIENALPQEITNLKFTYIEPFVGSGAVLFWMLDNFPNLENAVINDINTDLINTYKTIAEKPKELISILEILQSEFHALEENEDVKKLYYYKKRTLYNSRKEEQIRDFCAKLEQYGHKWMLSNSDVKGKNETDNFFDDLYEDFNIQRVKARRSINANPENIYLGVPLSGRAFRYNLLFVPHKRISTSIPNAA